MASQFKIHGDVNLSWHQDILEINSTGPWNMEFFHHLHAQLIAFVPTEKKGKFTVLLSISGEAVPTPDAQRYHTEFLKASTAQAVAVNLANCQSVAMTKAVANQVYTQAGLPHQIFNNRLDALQWLQNEVYKN